MSDPTPANAALTRQGFGESTAVTGIEMQAQALAAQAKAAVEARYILAMRRPRDLNTVRIKLKEECKRPSFAEEARYSIPRGQEQVTGPSIRFAEAAARAMTNLMPETIVVYDGPATRQLRVSVTDLEANLTYSQDIILAKTMERRFVRQGQTSLGQRYNSYGDLVHIVETTEDELNLRQAALVSKNVRTLILRLVPGDIIEECMNLCVAIIKDAHAKDPQASIKAICDGFAERGIMPDRLVQYLGKPLAEATADEVAHLRNLWAALRDGQTNWDEALERKLEGKPVAVSGPNVKKLDPDKYEGTKGNGPTPPPASAPPPASSSPQSTPPTPAPATPPEPPAQPQGQSGAARAQQQRNRGGTKAVTQQVKDAKAKEQAAAPPPTPGPGTPEWEAAKERAANKPAPLAVAPPPAPEPVGPDPHGDPPPPDDVVLPTDAEAPPHPAGDAPDWMA